MKSVRDTALRMLEGNILPFWQGLRDEEHGGFYGFMDIDLNLYKQAVKGCILNSRILWFFSEAARVLKRDDLLPYARHAYEFLVGRCIDREHGGVYWSVTYDGQPSDTTKHTYNQAFAVYALSAYYEAAHDRDALSLAKELFGLIESKCTIPGGYGEAYDRLFRPSGNEKLSENGVMAERTMNTLLHVFEAYGGLYRAEKDPAVAQKMRGILDTFADRIYNPAKERQEVFFDADWNSLIDLTSYGHDIEASWLVEWGCELLGDDALLRKIQAICSKLAENVRIRAFREGSLRNECERGTEDESRIWWVQAEAVVGFLHMAGKHPGNPEYRRTAEEILRFIEEKIVDKRAGSEWLSEVTPNGDHTARRKPVVEEWKCPYHNGRMCLEIVRGERMIHPEYKKVERRYERLIQRPNAPAPRSNGVFTRWEHPVLTARHVPPFWKYDVNAETNPLFLERLGVNAVFNAGALKLNGKYYLAARVEGSDRKSFFAVAESDKPTEGFRFWDRPVELPDTEPDETNVYDMRLTAHQDGWIYGVFCSESKDRSSASLSAAVAAAGIARTKDLKTWERLPNLVTLRSPQQRNVALFPRFVNGKYAFFTRPMDSFIDTGSGGGIGFGTCDDITRAVIDEERITSARRYHTITEEKNGAGAVPIYTPRGWIHIAHGVRNTAAGLRYVIYAFATDLDEPWRVTAEPGGYLIAPAHFERIGDVSNVVFTNGAIDDKDGSVYIYYASSDTRLHVASTTVERLTDYVFGTPPDALRSADCVKQRMALIERNLAVLGRGDKE